MKILYLASKYKPEYYNGTIKFVDNITKYFSEKNDVKLVTYSDVIPDDFLCFNEIKYWKTSIDNIDTIKFNIEDGNKKNYELFNKSTYEFAINIIKEFNPDIIHIGHCRMVASFIEAAINLKKRYIITLTDSFIVCPKTFLVNNSCQICNERHQVGICKKKCGIDDTVVKKNLNNAKRYFNNAYALVTPSNFQSSIYKEYFEGNFVVINHGNKLTKVNSESKKYPKRKLIFGFNGSSIALKGLNVAIAAFNKLENEEQCDVELHVHGFCDDTTKLISGKKVKFYGEYDNKEVYKILNEIDVLICPSIWYENYPFVITEAFANKLPVIATNEGGMKELVKNFVNGFTFELGDVDQLAEIIKLLYYNQNILDKISENLKGYKIKTIEDEMNEYSKLYNMIKNNKGLKIDNKYIVDNIWKRLIINKYGNIDFDKYMKYINESLDKYNYTANIDMKYRFILRLRNMEDVLRNKKCNGNICVWGAGMSGKVTIDIIKRMYSWININSVVDKYKYGKYVEGIYINDITSIEDNKFDYMLICTYPGKKEAEKKLRQIGKNINADYNFGICVE